MLHALLQLAREKVLHQHPASEQSAPLPTPSPSSSPQQQRPAPSASPALPPFRPSPPLEYDASKQTYRATVLESMQGNAGNTDMHSPGERKTSDMATERTPLLPAPAPAQQAKQRQQQKQQQQQSTEQSFTLKLEPVSDATRLQQQEHLPPPQSLQHHPRRSRTPGLSRDFLTFPIEGVHPHPHPHLRTHTHPPPRPRDQRRKKRRDTDAAAVAESSSSTSSISVSPVEGLAERAHTPSITVSAPPLMTTEGESRLPQLQVPSASATPHKLTPDERAHLTRLQESMQRQQHRESAHSAFMRWWRGDSSTVALGDEDDLEQLLHDRQPRNFCQRRRRLLMLLLFVAVLFFVGVVLFIFFANPMQAPAQSRHLGDGRSVNRHDALKRQLTPSSSSIWPTWHEKHGRHEQQQEQPAAASKPKKPKRKRKQKNVAPAHPAPVTRLFRPWRAV